MIRRVPDKPFTQRCIDFVWKASRLLSLDIQRVRELHRMCHSDPLGTMRSIELALDLHRK